MSISWNASLRPDPGDKVRGAGPGSAHAHPDPPRDAGVAVGRVRPALLVADEHVAQLRIVAEDVVQRQDHAAWIAEEDIDALAEQGFTQDVRTDPRPLQLAPLVEHLLAGALDGRRVHGPVAGHVAATRTGRRTRRLRGFSPGRRHGGPQLVTDKRKTLASRRGSLR